MKIASKENSAVDLVKEAYSKARQFADHNIFISLADESKALEKAREIDRKIEHGEEVGLLAGVPYALKDNFLNREGNTTAASRILQPFRSPINSTTVEKLEKEGAIMIGRTNLDAFAHGSSTENSYFGVTHNAKDPERVAGGSSGGSAVAVALDIVQFATGTDTGGSIRQPASFNGVFGFKPTYGTISRYGVVAMASSTDCVGFFTKNADDMDLLMSICSGQDKKDLTSLPSFYNNEEQPYYVPKINREKAIVGIIKDFRNDSIDHEVQRVLDQSIKKLEEAGHEIIELSMPILKYALAVYYVIVPAEVASNLSRYDGIRYGYRSKDAHNLSEVFGLSRDEGFMSENKRRIMIGNFVLSSGFYDAYFLKAEKVRSLILKEYNKAFSRCDFLLTPVSPSPAFKIGEKINDPIAMYYEDVLSVPINLAGLPSLAVPVGRSEKNHLPIGLQVIGQRRSDRSLLAFSKELLSEEEG